MPFTGAHPLAIVPLLRSRKLDATALVIGSMAPDFEYFAHAEESGSFGHTPLGLLVWCLPATLAIALIWHHVVKWPVIAASPRAIAVRVAGPARRAWQPHPLAFVVSALVGAASHDLWDAFTHADGFVVREWGLLRTPVTVPVLGHTVVHRVLQHGCSVVAFAIVIAIVARWIRSLPVGELAPLRAWRARIILTALVGIGVVATSLRIYKVNNLDAGSIVVAVIAGALAGTLIASLILRRDALVARSVSGGRDT